MAMPSVTASPTSGWEIPPSSHRRFSEVNGRETPVGSPTCARSPCPKVMTDVFRRGKPDRAAPIRWNCPMGYPPTPHPNIVIGTSPSAALSDVRVRVAGCIKPFSIGFPASGPDGGADVGFRSAGYSVDRIDRVAVK
jgi:hypothetical protein